MRREIFEKVLLSLYPNTKINIKEYDIHDKFELDENGVFVESEPCIFVGIETIKEITPECLSSDETNDISDEVCKFTGKEFNIYRICQKKMKLNHLIVLYVVDAVRRVVAHL